MQDINDDLEQRVAERTSALQEQQERLRAILDAPDDAIITIDQRGTIESVNSASERMFGYTSSEMVGRNVNLLMPLPYHKEHGSYLANYLKTGIRNIIGIGREVYAQRKDGSSFPVDLAVSEVVPFKLFTGILRDISRRKQLEKEVVEIATLERRQIGQELHDNLGQEMTALGLLAATLADTQPVQADKNIAVAHMIVSGLQRILGHVRTISHGLIPVEVDGNGLSVALRQLAARIDRLGDVLCSFSGEDQVIVEDNVIATHLFYIAQEACMNAVKHAQAKKIEISLQKNNQLILKIQDDGIGIADNISKGEGSGLRIMRHRASVIGANLIVQRMEPCGTTVRLHSPRGDSSCRNSRIAQKR